MLRFNVELGFKNHILTFVPMRSVLSRPYPINLSLQKRTASALGFGVFVFLFLYTFLPFGINTLGEGALPATAAYGAATTAVMLVLNIVFPFFFTSFFTEEKWTVLREIMWTAMNIFCIALANLWLSIGLNFTSPTWSSFRFFVIYTLAIGFFPLSISVLLAELRLRKKFEAGSRPLNEVLENPKTTDEEAPKKIEIIAENGKDNLLIEQSDLLYICAAENYIDVFWLQKNAVTKTVLRNSLKNVSQNLAASSPKMLRCHKSFLVNLNHVKHVSGNAQGYKLHLAHTTFLVPVSRQLNEELPRLIANKA